MCWIGADDNYVILEVKADYQVDALIVVAEQTFAEKSAASNMTCCHSKQVMPRQATTRPSGILSNEMPT